MNATVVRKFGCTIDAIKEAAKNIDSGLDDPALGDAVLSRMRTTFKADYEANLTGLVNAISSQAVACGKITELARALNEKVDKCAIRMGMARGLAKRRFAGDDALLHAEFHVGSSAPGSRENFVTRAEKMHAACLAHAEELDEVGWPASETTALAADIADINTRMAALHVAKEAKKGATAQVNSLANSLYDWCRNVQIVANASYPAADAQNNSQIPEARGRFLLGTFPPSANKPPTPPSDPTPTDGAAPASSMPTPEPGGTS